MTQLFDNLQAAAHSAENKILLAWEGYWYGPDAAHKHAGDFKRETDTIVLSATPEETAAMVAALDGSGAIVENAEKERIEIRFSAEFACRQPQALRLTPKKFQHVPEALDISGPDLLLNEAATLKDVLRTAALLARYPQLPMPKMPAQTWNGQEALDLPQAFRRLIFKSIISGRKPSRGLQFLDRAGLLEVFLPEVTAGRHLTQNRFHAHDIFDHLLHSVDGAMDLNEPVRWSALLHDIGKVPTRLEGPNGEASFHNHEMYSARMIVPIMKRLAVPIGIGQKVKFLVRNHMFHYTDEWTDKAVRRFVKKVPLEELQDLISLRLADRKGSGKKTAFPRALQNLMHHIDDIIAKEKEFKIKDLAIDGHVLIEMGMPQTRAMGDMLKYIFEEVKLGRLENTRDVLIAAVKARLGQTAGV